MKKTNLKIAPISLALLGGAALVSGSAQAYNSIKLVKSTDNNVNTYTLTGSEDKGQLYLREFFDIKSSGKTIVNINDPKLEVVKTLQDSDYFGALDFYAPVKTATFPKDSTDPVELEFNINQLKGIKVQNKSLENNAIIIRADLPNAHPGKYPTNEDPIVPINVKTTISGDQERTFLSLTDGTEKRNSRSQAVITKAYMAPGTHKAIYDAKNTTYKSEVTSDDAPINANVIRETVQHYNSRLDLDFNSGKAIARGGKQVKGISIQTFNYEKTKQQEEKPTIVNVNVNGGLIDVASSSNAYKVLGVETLITNGLYSIAANPTTTINGGEIKVAAGKDSLEIGGVRISYESHLTLSEQENDYAVIRQTGGKVTVDASNQKANTRYSEAYGLYAGVNYALELKAKVEQSGGEINLLNTRNGIVNSAALKATALNDAEIHQGADGIVRTTGTNNSAFYASSAGGNVVVNVAGTAEANSYGIITHTSKNQLSKIDIAGTAKLFADTAVYNSEGNSVTTIAKEATIGKDSQLTKFDLGWGDDTIILKGTNLNHISEFDGGRDSDVETDFDTLVFNDYTDLDLGNRLKNWERVELNNGSYRLTSDVNVGVGANSVDNSKVGGVVINANSTLHINNDPVTGRLVIDGDLHNQGVLDLRDSNPDSFTKLTVNNDYYGGGLIKINAKLAGDDSATDSLAINSDVYGKTKVEVTNVGDASSARDTVDGIKLIRIANGSTLEAGAESFQLLAPVEAGAYEYNTLSYLDTNGKKGFYLQSKSNIATDERNSGAILINGKEAQLRKDAIGYALNQQINAQALADLNSGLHSRSGEQRAETNYLNKNQSWVRYLGNSNDLTVSYLGAKTSSFGLQVGYDFRTTHNQDNRSRTGVALSYNKLDSKLKDDSRKDQVLPGKVSTDLSSLALYHTGSFGNAYFDLVGGLHFLHSDYAVVNGGQQNAFGGNLSVEGGYNLDLGNNFFVEPQVQLAYQGTRYADFKDATSEIKGYTHQSLRPRLGLRLGYHDVKGTNLWLHANLETEVLKTAKLTIGNDLVSVDRAGKHLYNLGLNGQVALSPTTVLYGSAQYKGSFDKKTTLSTGEKVKATKLKGFGGELGLRFTW